VTPRPSSQRLSVGVTNAERIVVSPYAALVLSVGANTSVDGFDASGGGDPYFTVALDGTRVVETDVVPSRSTGAYSIQIPARELRRYAGRNVTMNVSLWEGDVLADEFVRSSETTLTVAAQTPTPTPPPKTNNTTRGASNSTPTATPPSTTPRPATATRTPAPTSTATPSPSQRSSWEVTVARVVDGDTFVVRAADGHTETVRLLGVDTPEVHVENDPAEFEGIPDSAAGERWLRDWGHKASEFARTEVGGTTVTIETDPDADRYDRYDRPLVYAYDDGTDARSFNYDLLARGYARLYDSPFSKRGTFSSAESDARGTGTGLWNYENSSATPTPTSTVTATPASTPPANSSDGGGSLAVVRVHADADGNDHENLNDEYVVFENGGDETLDLSGWTISDEANHTYTFSGLVLDPGDRVTLYTGTGTDDASAVYWGAGRAVWNNGGDTVRVTSDDGETVLVHEY
jgi:micrococcal nuclease